MIKPKAFISVVSGRPTHGDTQYAIKPVWHMDKGGTYEKN